MGKKRTEFVDKRPNAKKPSKIGYIFMFISFAFLALVIIMIGLGESSEKQDTSSSASGLEVVEPEKPKYMEKVEWAALENYLAAVEVDDYDGDKLAAGTWAAYETDTDGLFKNSVPIVWTICLIDGDRADGDITLTADDIVAEVGGWEGAEAEFTVEPGQYVAVVYPNTAGHPVGILNLELKK